MDRAEKRSAANNRHLRLVSAFPSVIFRPTAVRASFVAIAITAHDPLPNAAYRADCGVP